LADFANWHSNAKEFLARKRKMEGQFPFFKAEFLSGETLEQGSVSKTRALQRLELSNREGMDTGPMTEIRARKDKLDACSKQASRIAAGLFVGGDVVAKDRDVLQAAKISHVINCVGQLYESYFEEQGIKYLTLFLNDSPKEDLLSILYDCFEFIDDARSSDGHVFVHCSQGVSRSMSVAIAYRMLKEGRSYEDVFLDCKQLRSVANPNIGFVFQLMQWWKRRLESEASANIYRIAPQSRLNPSFLVAKWLNSGLEARRGVDPCLDPRGTFVLHSGDTAYIWSGRELLHEDFKHAARRFATLLERYERRKPRKLRVTHVEQGNEDDAFLSLVETCLPSSKAARCDAFDTDFEIWTSQMQKIQSASESSRSRKTPRRSSESDVSDGESPNVERRKRR
jgi:protein-tyrosine phosphatase